jgi:polyisoprenyl-phosphate glycosyltransferase
MPNVSVVIPVYFNEGSLSLLYSRIVPIERALAEKSIGLELIFVDDGSKDNSLLELLKIKKARAATKIIKLTRNFGAEHASKTGLGFVTGDCFVILSADLQDPPEILLNMVDLWLAGNKFVIAERANRDDPPISRVLSNLYYSVLRLYVAPNYPKGGFDMALMDKSLLEYFLVSSKNIFTPMLAHWLGFDPVVIKYDRLARIHGKSRWTVQKKLTASLDVLLGFSVLPIRVISLLGVLAAILSLLYGFFIFLNAVAGNMEVPGFATLVTLIAFFHGLGLIMLGILGEYVWRIFDEVNKRPETVIDEVW